MERSAVMSDYFSTSSRGVVAQASLEAMRLGCGRVGMDHILLALARYDGDTGAVLRAVGAGPDEVSAQINKPEVRAASLDLDFSQGAKQMFEQSLVEAHQAGRAQVQPRDLLSAILAFATGRACLILTACGATPDKIRQRLDQTAPHPR
jgi:ATP-dependent Clp protease ATP-binding subunit ClpC